MHDPDTHYPVQPDPASLRSDIRWEPAPGQEARVEQFFFRAAELARSLIHTWRRLGQQAPAEKLTYGHVRTAQLCD